MRKTNAPEHLKPTERKMSVERRQPKSEPAPSSMAFSGVWRTPWLVLAGILNVFNIRPRQTGVRWKSSE